MKLSVIVPAYNEAEYLGKSLEALLAQDYPDFEVIVVDNASTDKTAEIARSYAVTVLSEKRKGTQWARECGRRAARGEIIVNMDADCIPEKTWLSRGAQFLKDSNAVAVTGPYDYYDASALFRSVSLLTQVYLYSAMNRVVQFFHLGGVVIGGNLFIRAFALEAIGGYNTAITFYGDDPDTGKRLAKVGYVAYEKSLRMRTSARRLHKQGILKIFFLYVFYFIISLTPQKS